jgi:predicted RND superfamily exporter protein
MLQKLSSLHRFIVVKHPIMALIVLGLLAIVAALGLPNFKLDASADALTLEHDSDLDYFREISKRYQGGDFLVVTYTPKADIFSDDAINLLQALREDLSQVEGVVSVYSMIDVPLLYSPIRSLAEQKESTRTLLTEGVDRELAKQEFLTSPIYRDMLLSPDGKTTALLINLEVNNQYIELVRHRDALRLKRDTQGLTANEALELERVSAEFLVLRTELAAKSHARVDVVRAIVDQYRGDAELFLGGASMITADMITYIKSDLVIFGIAILLFIVVMLAFIFRQLRFITLPLGICVLVVLLMLGWLSWVDWRLTVISSNFVALLLIMNLAIIIYLVVRYRELHAQHPDWSQEQLVLTTVHMMILPCLYTALTTIVAFMSLVVSDIRPVIDFGWMMTIGLSLALLLSFIIFPAVMMLLPKGAPRDKGDQSAAITLRFSNVAEHHGGKVLAVAAVLAITAIVGITRLEVENRFIDYFHDDSEIYQGMSVIDKQLGGTVTLEIILDAPASTQTSSTEEDPFAAPDYDTAGTDVDAFDDDAFDDPFGDDPFASDEFAGGAPSTGPSYWFSVSGLDDVKKLHDYLESLPEVGKVQSLATAYQVAQDINGGRLNQFELGVMRQMLSDDIQGFLITPYLSDADQQTRITLRVKETSPELKRAELVKKVRAYAENDIGFQPEQVKFTGMLVLYNNMLESLFHSQIATMGMVFLGIMVMFILLFRSVSIALISIFPNILAASVVLGGMGIAGIPLDMMTITIAAIVVGVGVDHAIHYFYRFRIEFAQTGNYIEAMHRSHASIGRAMYYTAIIIIVGFSILALSQFIPSIYFGLLTAFAMFAAIVGSLTLLPKLILMFKPLGPERVVDAQHSLKGSN